jgi:long-subunit fatty acid transport protein
VKHLLLAAIPVLSASSGLAGGIDQSGQSVALLYRDGNYAEASFGLWMPTLSGTDAVGGSSGNVYGDIPNLAFGLKRQFGDRWSAALLADQPWGVNVDYPGGDFAYAGTSAEVRSLGLTALARYRLDDRFSLHGGLRATRLDAAVGYGGAAFGPLSGYDWDAGHDWGFGWVAGGAFEVPAIALRVALTWSSETEFDLPTTETFPAAIGLPPLDDTTEVTMPQSVNLDFQTGIAADTLLYGSVRWVDWEGWSVAPPGLAGVTGGTPLVRFEADAFTYKLGLGRQLTDAFAGAVEIAHETGRGEEMTALDPYDGYTAVSLGGSYAMQSGLELAGGLSYSFLGDAETDVAGSRASFDGNHALSAAIRVGYRF